MNSPASERPPLSADLDGAEFLRWYWLKDELSDFARANGHRASGNKELLTRRIAAALDGRPFTEPAARSRGPAQQLTGPLSGTTIIPAGQRCSQLVREWMRQHIGPNFHFDAAMRGFFAGADGTGTLQDAVDHWRRTRNAAKPEIDAQFEYNRFTRAWYASNPNGTRDQVIAAWNVYRSRPVDERA